jgi:acetylornithine deacetylase/succinyl-diaminopimelate desuccinylase-like protein
MEIDARTTYGIEEPLASGVAYRERLSFAPTANVAGVHGGYSGPGTKTILVAAASAWLDFRLVPDQEPGEIFELLQAHLDREGFSDIKVTLIGSAERAP